MTVEERTAVEAEVTLAVLDYFEGWFDGDADRMAQALHPDLAKRALEKDGTTLDETTAEWMIDATARGVGRELSRSDNQIEVKVEDVYDTIANVTVRSALYREYVQLVRTAGAWKIVNTLWQPT